MNDITVRSKEMAKPREQIFGSLFLSIILIINLRSIQFL